MTYQVSKADIEAREYKTFKLTVKEQELLSTCIEPALFLYPKDNAWKAISATEKWQIFKQAWALVAERNCVHVETICAHPDGLPYFLAKEAPRMRTRKDTRGGGFEDDEHHTPNR